MRRRDRLAVSILVALCFLLVGYRVFRMERDGEGDAPVRHHELNINMRLFGHGDDVKVLAYLPMDTERQSVKNEVVSSGTFRFAMEREDGNRLGVWDRRGVAGPQSLLYSCVVRTDRRKYELEPNIPVPAHVPPALAKYVRPTEKIQSDSKEVQDLFRKIVPEKDRGNATAVLRAAFDAAHDGIAPVRYSGTTDALTCLRLGESSCGGKTRLFVALVRAAGLPARMVGGVILKSGTWHAGHIWAEVRLGDLWVPFCPLNGYFAEVPDRYLVTYIGDLPQFEHTRDINFQYDYHAKRILAPPDVGSAEAWARTLDAPNLWAAFEQVRIPVNLLKIILMVPFGALMVVLCRNIVGIETFGTFMPALIAVAFRDTGFGWGTALLILVIATGVAVRFLLGRFQLLHTPRLAVLLTMVVLMILGLSLLGQATGQVLPTRISLFPLAILALTVERFSVMLEEDGTGRALGVFAGTLVVVAAAYSVMNWERLQVAVLMFPELLLLVIASMFVLGRWSGMRLSELVRFRELAAGGDR